jgi:hypothetical protein
MREVKHEPAVGNAGFWCWGLVWALLAIDLGRSQLPGALKLLHDPGIDVVLQF